MPDRLDLSPLDPTADPERFDRIVGSILARAEHDVAARRVRGSAFAQVVEWRKPTLAAAAVLLLVCAGVLLGVRVPESAAQYESLAEAMGVPTVLAQGIRSDRIPSAAELLFSIEEER